MTHLHLIVTVCIVGKVSMGLYITRNALNQNLQQSLLHFGKH